MINSFRGSPRWKRLHPDRGMFPSEIEALKKRIRLRLATEDYSCRLPKPRVRYRLRLVHRYWQIGLYPYSEWVYK